MGAKPTVTLHLGDWRDILPMIDTSRIAAVVTDPPYGMKWRTDSTRFSGGRNGHRHPRGEGRSDWGEIHGDAEPFDPSPWLDFSKVILWGANHFSSRLPVGTTLVWVKKNEAVYGSFLSDAEIAWMKGGHGVYLRKDLSMKGLTKSRVHPSQKPVGLMCWCIKRLNLPPGSLILDPFMGSGTTGIAAVDLGHDFIGIEVNPAHFAVAERRIKAAIDRETSDRPLFSGID